MQHIALGHPIAPERAGVVVVVDLQNPAPYVGGVGGEELIDVVAIYRLAAVKPPVPTDRRQPAEAAEAHRPNRGPGEEIAEPPAGIARQRAPGQLAQRSDRGLGGSRSSLHDVDPRSVILSQLTMSNNTPPSTRLHTCDHCRCPFFRVTGVQGPGLFDSQVAAWAAS